MGSENCVCVLSRLTRIKKQPGEKDSLKDPLEKRSPNPFLTMAIIPLRF